MTVHNHRPYRGPGPDGSCPEHVIRGELRGACMPEILPISFINPENRQALSGRPDKPQRFVDQVSPDSALYATAVFLDYARTIRKA